MQSLSPLRIPGPLLTFDEREGRRVRLRRLAGLKPNHIKRERGSSAAVGHPD